MLGASQSHAQTTVGVNFQLWSYDSGTTTQTVGYGYGYLTTGFTVTTNAFGVGATNWSSADPLYAGSPISGLVTFDLSDTTAGSLSVDVTAGGVWGSSIGQQNPGWVPETVSPGNDEVTWAFLYGNPTHPLTASVSGLASKFPNGYVVQAIGSADGNSLKAFNNVDVTDGQTTNILIYSVNYVTNISGVYGGGGTVGITPSSGAFASDTINLLIDTNGANPVLSGFILTDKPVLTWVAQPGLNLSSSPVITNNLLSGTAMTLNALAIGIPPLSYQWQLNGTNIPGATFMNYTNPSLNTAAGGIYSLTVTNHYGVATSAVASVTIFSLSSMVWSGNVNDTWDIGSTANWTTNGIATAWIDDSAALFDDTAANTSVNVATTVSPYSITVTNNTKAYVIAGDPIAGAASLIKEGTNSLTLSGANTFTGNMIIGGGSLTIADQGVLGGGVYAAAIANNGTFIWDSSAMQTNDGVMSGTGSLVMNSGGIFTLAALNTLSGGITVSNGTLVLAAGALYNGGEGCIGTGPLTIESGATVSNDVAFAIGGNAATNQTVRINRGTFEVGKADYFKSINMTGGTISIDFAIASDRLRPVNASEIGGAINTYPSPTTAIIDSSNSINGSGLGVDIGPLTFNVAQGTTADGRDLLVDATIDDTGGGGGSYPVMKTGAGTMVFSAANDYAAATLVSNGKLVVDGSLDAGSAVYVASTATLSGTGIISGTITNDGVIAPGDDAIGTLTVGGALALDAGSTSTFKVNGSVATNDTIVLGSTLTYGGTLNIVPTGTFTSGQTFTLFSGVGAAGAGNFANITGSPGGGLRFSFTNGVLSVVSGPGALATITNNLSGNILSLSWPVGQGWRLEWQTNNLATGLGTNWMPATDDSISSTNITINPGQPAAFYRLVYP